MLTYPFKFVPSSPAQGTFSYNIVRGALSMTGSGTYTVEDLETDSPTIVAQTTSVASAMGESGSGSGPAHIKLVPLDSNDCNKQ